MSLDAEFYASNTDAFEALTEEERDIILNGGNLDKTEVDNKTETETDNNGSDNQKETDNDSESGGEGQDIEVSIEDIDSILEDEDLVIQSKNGKHELPYKVLEESRQATAAAKAEAEQYKQALEKLESDLQSASKKDDKSGTTEATEQVMSEWEQKWKAYEEENGGFLNTDKINFKDLLNEIVDSKINPLKKELQSTKERADNAEKTIKQLEEIRVQEKNASDWDKIQDAHPDLDELMKPIKVGNWETNKVGEWISKQPDFIQESYWKVAESGTPDQKIELLNLYKQAQPSEKPQAVAKTPSESQLTVKSQPKTPKTLSSVGGKGNEISEADAYLDASKGEQQRILDKIGNDPVKLEKFLIEVQNAATRR